MDQRGTKTLVVRLTSGNYSQAEATQPVRGGREEVVDAPLSRDQVYKKWMNMKSKAKDELMNRKKDHIKTGGGKPVFATPMDSMTETISGILGHDNICVGGVGGNDTTVVP
ncbi:hypothetical protein Pmani_030034 [Petrolisthes manimaculis]|uniref:Uncharacterized protein n=1 Tax=Petrolisthes manimaculis TaxID=1843537 RepID=A0AAE1NXK7_9EUCA|nr:hypothetical protein Pmani_030034 [Petrolisthes manimaculis]